ncbi:MAG: T9SS type A sorting domain-containing protein [Flavobacteriales bacterium]|nr:T9SS type A sorting domain-containing protein [Flavobacteriales bacterium]
MMWTLRIVLITVLCVGACSCVRAQQPFDLDPTFRAEFDDWYVSSILPQPAGKVIISGQFTFPGGEPLEFTGIARLNADGSWDPSFEHSQLGRGKLTAWTDRFYVASTQAVRRVFLDGTNDDGYHLGTVQIPYFLSLQGGDYHVYPDGRVLMSGAHQVNYPDSNWVGIYNLIWFTNEGYLDTTRAPRMGDGVIDRFKELPDGKFICTGPMSVFEGQPTSNIFRVHDDGSFDPSFSTGTNWGQAFSYLPLPDGRCYVAGLFTMADAVDTLQVVRLMPDGSLDPTFNNYLRFGIAPPIVNPWGLGFPGSLNWLDDGRIIVAGTFQDVDGESRGHICVIDTSGQLLDDYFVGAGCGFHTYQGLTIAGIENLLFTDDSMCYIWGEYHGYSDGTTNDPDQRFVTRLYGPDFGMGVEQRPRNMDWQLVPNPTSSFATLRLEQIPRNATVVVRDALGREMLRHAVLNYTTTLSVQDLGDGMYTVELLDAGQRLGVQRLVVQH